MKLRALAILTAAVLTFGLLGTSTAEAKQSPGPASGEITAPVDCTVLGVPATCELTVTGFRLVDGVLTAVGNVTGGEVSVPFQAPVQAAGTCQILDLTLGPLDLDLLGLVVHLDTVHLNITAESGPGNLLGNLLCAVAGLLDGPGLGNALQQIVNLLNQILGAL
jgi:hypothetical protein